MNQSGGVERERDLIDRKYQAKLEEFASRRPDLSQSEAEQRFLLYCHELSELFDERPPTPFLRQAAWRWLTEGPREAKRYARV